MNRAEKLAFEIVRSGWFAPSVLREYKDNKEKLRAAWVPLWGEPELNLRVPESPEAELLRKEAEAVVDRLVRERLTPTLSADSFQELQPRYAIPTTPLERWVNDLLHSNPEAASDIPEWIAEDLSEWQRSLTEGRRTAPIRAAFALIEPQRGRGWRIVPGIQAADEPSCFVSAAEVWVCPEENPEFFGRRFPSAQERLSEGLAQASRRFPPLESYDLRQGSCSLSEEEAAQFLETAGWALEDDGFGIIVPAWWRQPSPLVTSIRYYNESEPLELQSREAPPTYRTLGFDSLIHFRKELLLFGEPLTDAEWAKLSGSDSALAKYNGRWFRLSTAERKAYDRYVLLKGSGKTTLGEALQTVLSTEGSAETAGPQKWRADEAIDQWIQRANGAKTFQEVPVPEQFRGTLREYQHRGYSWLVHMRKIGFGACLADDMGLGKTIQWIAYALHVKQETIQAPSAPMLLVCPTSVLGNWLRELERFAPGLRVYFHYGAARAKGTQLSEQLLRHDIVLTSYATALRDRKELGAAVWEAVTLDEAQMIKNSGTKLTRFVRMLSSRHRIAMTGTPIENRLTELWSISEFINPGYLGTERGFRRSFADAIERDADGKASKRLSRVIQPFVLRRLKSDPSVISDLPEKIEQISYCTLTKRQAALYASVLQQMTDALQNAGGIRRRGIILSTITKLKQVCNAPAHVLREKSLESGSSGKLVRLEELLAEAMAAEDRTIVFSQYATMAALLQPYLSEKLGCEVGMIIGRTPQKEREKLIERFQFEAAGPKVLILSLKTGGFGLNLTRANRLIHYDRWWNPALERQATDRVHRIGQTRTVEVWKLVTTGTLEESIERLLQVKEQLADDVIGSGDRWITEYNDEELQTILSLRNEIVMEEER